jgi:hypothetical protein
MSEIKYISKRVSYLEKPDELTVIILANGTPAKLKVLTIWLGLFVVCGLILFSQLFVPGYDGYTKIGIFAFTSFWAYFIYKVGYVWFWRRDGREFLRIYEGKLSVKRAIKTYGKSHEFLLGNIGKLERREINEKSFGAELENSFWVLGGERLKFDYLGREIRFGLQITEEEAKKLAQLLIKWMKNVKE